jgi:putative phosphoesterase
LSGIVAVAGTRDAKELIVTLTIVALSDSHTNSCRELPPQLLDALQTADVIIHAGDHTEMSLLDELKAMGEVVAVAGNMDSMALKVRLPMRQLVSVGGKTVGVTHGSGAPGGIAQRVRASFPEKPDLIVFGHSHVPFSGMVSGVLMVNPGPAMRGYAVITVGKEVTAQLIATG